MKKLVFLIGISLIGNLALKAQQLAGEYFEEFDYIAEHNSHYRFDMNGQFDYWFWDDVENIFASGSYTLRNDSLILSYKALPEEAKAVKIVADKNEKDVSTFFIVSPVSSMPHWKCSYQVFEDDSLIVSGNGNQYGCFETRLEFGQTLKTFAHISDAYGSELKPIQFDIKGTEYQQDYVVIATGIQYRARIISSHTKGYRIRVRKNEQRFALKVNDDWVWYKIRNK